MSSKVSWKARWGNMSLVLMVLFSLAQLMTLFSIIRWVAPTFWESQLAMGVNAIGLVVLCFSATNSILEFFVHRYMMHATLVPWLKEVTQRHRIHHRLTSISLVRHANIACKRVWSRFGIVEMRQWQYVNFRDSLLAIFYAVNIPTLALLQWLLPHVPIVIGGYIAITSSFIFYEVIHVIEHRPDTWWQGCSPNNPIMYLLGLLRRFHQYHHMNAKCNMAIAGFFGIPLADILFGTFKLPRMVLAHGTILEKEDWIPKPPSRFIIWLDHHAGLREQNLLL